MKVARAARAVVCLSLWLCVCQVRGFHIPAKMNRTIQNLLQHYTIPREARYDGKPVFSSEILTGRLEGKRVFMGGVLETYEKLLSKMLKQQPTPSPQTIGSDDVTAAPGAAKDVREELGYLLGMVQQLRKHSYQDQDKVLHGLNSLRHIQMDNSVVQSKALWELPRLYEEASALSAIQMQRRRRRRQARRSKTQRA